LLSRLSLGVVLWQRSHVDVAHRWLKYFSALLPGSNAVLTVQDARAPIPQFGLTRKRDSW